MPFLIALLLLAGTLALYARTAGFPFVNYDDPQYVALNPVVARGLSGPGLAWAFTSTSYQYNWHPLTWLSHMLDVQIFGLAAGGHHLVNAALHAVNAALLFLALRALSGRLWPSALVAALFAVHPLRVESVAWVAERKDVLAGTFFMLVLLAHARQARAPSRASYLLVFLALAGGLLAKPTLVMVPGVLLLLDWWPLGRAGPDSSPPPAIPSLTPTHPGKTLARTHGFRAILEKIPLLLLSLGSAAMTLLAQHGGGAVSTAVPLPARLENALVVYATYLGQTLWPAGLAVFYPHPAIVEPECSRALPVGLAAAVLAAVSFLAWRWRRRRPWLAVGWLWFLGMLVPMIGLVQVGDQARADRYAYLPLIGIYLAVIWSGAELLRAHPALRPAAWIASAVVLLACSVATWRQLDTWSSSTALFSHALAVTEENYVAHNNLGLALDEDGQADRALEHFERSRAIRPGFFQAELNVGKARNLRNELEPARAAFEAAARSRPGSPEAHFCLGVVLARLGLLERADSELRAAERLDPTFRDDPAFQRAREALDERLPGR